jgi:undecaprenyl-diphosphatase
MTAWSRLEAASAERSLCLAMNRWGARHALRRVFGIVSRLGDGVFWYALMAVLALFGGARGAVAALHMALVGLAAAMLYRLLKRWTRRSASRRGTRCTPSASR